MSTIVINDAGHVYIVYTREELDKLGIDPASMEPFTLEKAGIDPASMVTIPFPGVGGNNSIKGQGG